MRPKRTGIRCWFAGPDCFRVEKCCCRFDQWQLNDAGASSAPLMDPFTARLDARMSAIRKAPVMLAPKPSCIAKAGTKIKDANAKPVPRSSLPEPEGLLAAAAGTVATALALMEIPAMKLKLTNREAIPLFVNQQSCLMNSNGKYCISENLRRVGRRQISQIPQWNVANAAYDCAGAAPDSAVIRAV